MTPLRRTAALATAIAAVLFVGAVPAAASADQPVVHVTRFSPVARGTVGAPSPGVRVTVRLVRRLADADGIAPGSGTTVATATASTAADGSWSAALPAHAPSQAGDAIEVDYAGAGAPADGRYPQVGDAVTNEPQVAPFGATIDDDEATYSGVSVSRNGYSWAATYDDDAAAWRLGGVFTDLDTVAATTRQSVDGSVLEVTQPGALPGLGLTDGSDRGVPGCTADLGLATVSCTDVSDGLYALVQRRGATTVRTVPAAATGCDDDCDASGAFPGLRAGDVVELRQGTALGRLLSALHVAPLRIDRAERRVDAPTVSSSGRCPAGAWLGTAGDALCPASGAFTGGTGYETVPDDLSAGTTIATLPDLDYAAPADGEALSGPFVAHATALLDGAATASPVRLDVTPAAGGTTRTFAGSNRTAGATVTGLPAGRYVATWRMGDANGDTLAVRTTFTQARSSVAATAPKAPAAPATTAKAPAATPTATAPAAPSPSVAAPGTTPAASTPAAVTATPSRLSCTVRRARPRRRGRPAVRAAIFCRVSTDVSRKGAASVRLQRGRRLVATGHGRLVRGRTTVRLSARKLARGTYVASVAIGATRATTHRIRLR